MLKRRLRLSSKIYGMLLLLLSGVGIYVWAAQCRTQETGSAAPTSYRVLEDSMGTDIIIGVASNVDEKQLRETLSRAADDHQTDAARDYIGLDHLWVEAYLVEGEKRSAVPAGRMRRYVHNPGKHDGLVDKFFNLMGRKKDKFTVTLVEARRSLN